MTPGDLVHLAPVGEGDPTVVIGADRIQFMVPAERVSAIPAAVEQREDQTLPPGCP